MKLNIFKNFVDYFFSDDSEKMAGNTPLKYITAGNGIFEIRSNDVMTVTTKVEGAKGMPELVEGFELKIPKIPFSVFNTIISFMKKIYQQDGTESTIMVFYNKEKGEFIPWVPLQENSGTSSNYKRDEDPEYTEMCKNNVLVMVAHSHPWASSTPPSPSGTDNNDEKEAIIYMIVGNVNGIPTITVSTCPGGKRRKLGFLDVFENPLVTEYNLTGKIAELITKYVPADEILSTYVNSKEPVPEEWIKRCTKKQYRYANTGKTVYTQYYGRNYASGTGLAVSNRYTDFDDDYYDNYYAGYGGYYQTSILKDDKYKIVRGEDLSDEPEVPDVADVIDICLDHFDQVQIAELILALKREGYGSLIAKCIGLSDEKVESTKKKNRKKAGK